MRRRDVSEISRGPPGGVASIVSKVEILSGYHSATRMQHRCAWWNFGVTITDINMSVGKCIINIRPMLV